MTAYYRSLAIVLLACGLTITSGSVASAIGQPSWQAALADDEQKEPPSKEKPKSASPSPRAGAKTTAKPDAAKRAAEPEQKRKPKPKQQGTAESEEEPTADPDQERPAKQKQERRAKTKQQRAVEPEEEPIGELEQQATPKPKQQRTAANLRTDDKPAKKQTHESVASTGDQTPKKRRSAASSVRKGVEQTQAETPIQVEDLAEPVAEPTPATESPEQLPWQTQSGGAMQSQTYGDPSAILGMAPPGFSAGNADDSGSGNYFDDGCFEPMCDDGLRRAPIYVRAEYLLWWLKGDRLPPLVTTSPSSTPQVDAGVLGNSTTSILFGNQSVNNSGRSGTRLVAGWWISPGTRIEGDGFVLGGQSATYNQSSDGSTVIARPFFNLSSGVAASNVLAYPSVSSGNVSIRESSNFVGGGLNVVRSVSYDTTPIGYRRRIDLIYGVRYLGLYENLTGFGSSTLSSQPQTSSSLTTNDGFKTSNSFFGANIGASVEHARGSWSLLSVGRLGIGETNERVTISGNSLAKGSDGSITASNGGFLAMPTNIGSYTHGGFALVPQLEFKLAYHFSPNIIAHFGYDVMYWSRVARPGGQIDLNLNSTQTGGGALTGTPGPTFQLHESDLWIQGINTGVEFRF